MRKSRIITAPAQPDDHTPAEPIVLEGWLAVSTEGFAAMNAGRDPAHLVKELVQNALDAVGDGGRIELDCRPGPDAGTVLITCRDNGCGMHKTRREAQLR
jgi:signal transduction histidine kinase